MLNINKRRRRMKLSILAGVVLFLAIAYLLYSNIPFWPPSTRANEGKILVQTHWMGEGPYARFTPEPESQTHGCWSTALAQIAYFHMLRPTGISKYTCSNGQVISENLNDCVFTWAEFDNEITDTTPQASADQIARYCYSVATIVRKDFGTGRYLTKLPPIADIENRLNVDARLYLVYHGIPHTRRKIRNIVIREIEADRPVFMYYRNMDVKGSGHSIVLDGYRFTDDRFEVHLNFGWGGRSDGWYDLFKGIATEGDTGLRFFITIAPRIQAGR